MNQRILALTNEQQVLIVEVARKLGQAEQAIATAWTESYHKEGLSQPGDRSISDLDFQDQVRLFLTSLSDGNFAAYFDRIANRGLELARSRVVYEQLILSFHLYEDALTPYLQQFFSGRLGSIVAVLDRLSHNVIAILARSYFLELDREKEKFISIVTHDLKTPLTAIMLTAQALSKNQSSPDSQTKAIERILRSGKVMSELIDSILEYGKLKSGKSVLNVHSIDVVDLVKEAAILLAEAMAAKRLRFTLNGRELKDCGAMVPVMARADRILIMRAINNYYSNAIKHARYMVAVEVCVDKDDVVVSVQDDGPGIPLAQLPHVFDDYFVISGAKAGTVLGLPSVLLIMQLHRGRCGAESDPGKGSRFNFRLPR